MSKGIIDQKGKKLIGPGKKSISGWVNVGGSIHQQTATHSLCHSTVHSYTPVAHTNTHSHTFVGTVKDIYSDYVRPWRLKIAVIRKLARHLSLQQPIKRPVPPAVNGKKLHQKNDSHWPLDVYVCFF